MTLLELGVAPVKPGPEFCLSYPGFFATVDALMQQVNIGIIGGGTVGSGVFHHLEKNGALLESRLGVIIGLRKNRRQQALDESSPLLLSRIR